MAGVAGGWTQVIAQVGGSVTLAVQAGFEGEILDWRGTFGRSYWFMFAWTAVLCGQYVILYKEPGTPEEEHENARRRIMEKKGEIGV